MNNPITLTDGEIVRTAFKALPPQERGHRKDPNENCPYCKDRSPERITDADYLMPFSRLFSGKRHKVFNCLCCSAVFTVVWPQINGGGQNE